MRNFCNMNKQKHPSLKFAVVIPLFAAFFILWNITLLLREELWVLKPAAAPRLPEIVQDSPRHQYYYIYEEDLLVENGALIFSDIWSANKEGAEHGLEYIFHRRMADSTLQPFSLQGGRILLERTHSPQKASFFYIPAYINLAKSRLSKSRVATLWERQLEIAANTTFWRRCDGCDHLLVFSSGNAIGLKGLAYKCMSLVVDKGKKNKTYTIGMPYPSPSSFYNESMRSTFAALLRPRSRPNLFYFRYSHSKRPSSQARHQVRTDLYNYYHNVTHVGNKKVIVDGSKIDKFLHFRHLMDSTFCACPRGLTSATARFQQVILAGCIPVVLSNSFIPPFESVLNPTDYMIQHDEKDIGSLLERLRRISDEEIYRLQRNLLQVRDHMIYPYPPKVGDAFHMGLEQVLLLREKQYTRFLQSQNIL